MRYDTTWIEDLLHDYLDDLDKDDREIWLDDLEYGGCASGLVMELVTYHKALELYNEHEDDVLGCLEAYDLTEHEPQGETFAALACWRLSAAFEAAARDVYARMDFEDEDEDEDTRDAN